MVSAEVEVAALRPAWPGAMVAVGILLAVVGGLVLAGNASNHRVCQAIIAQSLDAGGCSGEARFYGGGVGMVIGAMLFFGGVAGLIWARR